MLRWRRSLALVLAVLLAVCFMSSGLAVADANPAKEPITFKLISSNRPLWDEPMDADPIGRWITEQTGVTLEVEIVTGDANEKYNLLLATGEYPDLMFGVNVDAYVNEDALVALDDYLDMMPNLVSKLGARDIGLLSRRQDGKLYRIPTWYMGETMLLEVGMSIRDDVMYEEFGERSRTKTKFTISEIEQMFRNYKAKNPTTPDGNTVYPLTDFTWSGGLPVFCSYGEQMFGVVELREISDTEVIPNFMQPEYLDMLKWYNKLYREELLDPEFAINKIENMNTKLVNGTSIAAFAHNSEFAQINTALQEQDPSRYMQSHYYIISDEGKEAYRAMYTLGQGGLSVTKNCKDIPRAMEFIDFMSEPLTNFILCNGLEGGVWEFDENGKVRVLQEKIDAIPDLFDRFREYGAYKYFFMMNEGVDPRFEAFDSLTYEPLHGLYGVMPKDVVGINTWWEPEELLSRDVFSGIQPEAGTPEALSGQAITDIWMLMLPQIIMAGSEEEVVRLYEDAIEQVKAAGLDARMEVISKYYFERKARSQQ